METEKPKFISFQDVKFVIAIVVFLIPIIMCYADINKNLALIQQQLNTIKSNDLAHIETAIAAIEARNTVQDGRTIGLELSVARLLTLHEK